MNEIVVFSLIHKKDGAEKAHDLNENLVLPATDEEIAAVLGVGMDFMDLDFEDDVMDMLDLTTLIDMLASDGGGSAASVNITFERLVFPLTRISAEAYMELAAETLEMMGMTVHFDFPGTTRIGAYDWYSYGSSMDMFGTMLYGRYFVNVQGGFVRVISIIYHEGTPSVEEILEHFEAL